MSREGFTEFVVNLDDEPYEWITVRLQDPKEILWGVVKSPRKRLNDQGKWIDEPMPSNRDDEFFAHTRWAFDEAVERARQARDAS